GGVLGGTKGLYAKYGRERLLDTPLSESAYIGAAIGAATCGLRPVAELMFIDFMGVCFDQIYNQAAKFRYMFGGKAQTPVTIRAMVGAGFRAAGVRRRGHAALQHRRRRVGPGGPAGLLVTAGRDRDGQRSPHAGAVLARPRRRLCPERGEGGQRRAPHDGQGMTVAEGITPV